MRPNWQRMLSCAYKTQLLHSSLRYVGITMIVTLFGLNLCAGSQVGVYLQQLTIGSFVGAQLG